MARRNGGFIGTDGLDAPDPPTGVTVTAGGASGSVAFTAPTDTGTSAITGFVAQVSTNGTDYSVGSNTGTSSPIVVSSLTNGTAHTAKVWAINAYGTSSPSDASASFSPLAPVRGLVGGGYTSSFSNVIQYVNIASASDGVDFGDLTTATKGLAALASSTRAVFGGGDASNTRTDTMEYVTIDTTGNATDFGNLATANEGLAAGGSATRGIFSGGYTGSRINVMQYITIANTGNTTDFGDLTVSRSAQGSAGSTVRLVNLGGSNGGANLDVMDYVTIASTGNASDFGNLTVARSVGAACSSATRLVYMGGYISDNTNIMDYITIASTGNATDFGDLSSAARSGAALSSKVTGLHAGGHGSNEDGGTGNTGKWIQAITIATLGNSTSHGDLLAGVADTAGCSEGHGGLA